MERRDPGPIQLSYQTKRVRLFLSVVRPLALYNPTTCWLGFLLSPLSSSDVSKKSKEDRSREQEKLSQKDRIIAISSEKIPSLAIPFLMDMKFDLFRLKILL